MTLPFLLLPPLNVSLKRALVLNRNSELKCLVVWHVLDFERVWSPSKCPMAKCAHSSSSFSQSVSTFLRCWSFFFIYRSSYASLFLHVLWKKKRQRWKELRFIKHNFTKQKVYQLKDISAKIRISLQIWCLSGALEHFRLLQNNSGDSCMSKLKEFPVFVQSLQEEKKGVEKEKGRLCVHIDEFNTKFCFYFASVISDAHKYLTLPCMCRHCLWGVRGRSGLIRAFKVLPWWEILFCYFSSQDIALYLSSGAFLHSVCSCTVDKSTTMSLCVLLNGWELKIYALFRLKLQIKHLGADRKSEQPRELGLHWVTYLAVASVFFLWQPTWVASLLFRIPLK